MDVVNHRGAASIAALALAAIVTAAAAQMAASVRAMEQRSNEKLEETTARSHILVRAIEEVARFPDEETVRVSDFTEQVGPSPLHVRVTWRRTGGRWHVVSWMEVRAWPDK